MNKRIVMAGVAAGLALFVWEAIAHMATPLGAAGLKSLPNEAATVATLDKAVPGTGLFFYPTPKEMGGSPAPGSPTGLLLIHHNASLEMNPAQFVQQLGFDIVAMLLAAYIVARLAPGTSFSARLSVVLMLSLVASLRSGLPMWNWYSFPKRYVAAQLAIDVVGFLIGGVIVARLAQPRAKSSSAAA